MYTALYRRYRPRTFDEIVGQDHIVKILKKQIETGNVAHAYLFCGTRGTGKTSAARIFAKGVNCLSERDRPCGKCENCESIQAGIFFDVIEIDAASNNRVDNIRELRESVKYPPAAGLCKVYIIDEVHMLSTGAFNALLKTLEEPPEQVIFILATTEPHKLPATILSRCLRLDFRRVSEMKIKDKLRQICEEQEIEYEESALSLIAANGDGSVRDALSILEQCMPAGEKILLRKDVVDIIGTVGEDVFLEITDKVKNGETAGAFLTVDKIAKDGKDIRQFIKDWIFHFRNLMMTKYADKLEDIMNMSCENVEKVKKQGESLDMGFISAAISELSSVSNKVRYSAQPRTLLELSILKLSNPRLNDNIDALIQRIERLEKNENVKAEIFGEHNSSIETAHKKIKEDVNRIEELPPWEDCSCDDIIKSDIGYKKPEGSSSCVINEGYSEKQEESANKACHSQTEERGNNHNNNGSIWNQVLKKAIEERASLRLLIKDVKVINETENQIVLGFNSLLKKNMLEQNSDIFEKYIELLKGKKVRIITQMLDEKIDEGSSKNILSDTKSQLKALLGEDKLTFTE